MEKQNSVYQKPAVMLGLAVLCTALWGSASPCIKLSYQLFQIGTDDLYAKCLLAGVRFGVAGLLIILAGAAEEKRLILPALRELPRLLGLGLMYTALQYLFFYMGLSYTTGAKGALFSSVGCFFVVLLTPLLVKGERYSWPKLLGCVLGFIGLMLISAGKDLSAMSGFTLAGDGAVLLSSLCSALSVFYSKKLMERMRPSLVIGWQMLLGATALGLFGYLNGGRLAFDGGWKPIALLGYMCLLSAVAYYLWAQLIKFNPVNRVTITQLLIPVFGAVFSAIILGESVFTLLNLAALVLVCAGIWLVNRR